MSLNFSLKSQLMRHLIDLAIVPSIIVVRPPEMNALQELPSSCLYGDQEGYYSWSVNYTTSGIIAVSLKVKIVNTYAFGHCILFSG